MWPGIPTPPANVRAIIEERYMFAEYWDPSGRDSSAYEMYDLLTDPQETYNIAFPGNAPYLTPEQQAQKARLSAKLAQTVTRKLAPRLGVAWPISVSGAVDTTAASDGERSATGAVTGTPLGGFPTTLPAASAQVVFTPAGGFVTAAQTGACIADVDFSLYSGAGSIQGTAKAVCQMQRDGTATFDGKAAVLFGTGAFRGLRGEGLKFTATSPPLGSPRNGSVSLVGTAYIKELMR